ncbi:hypothetical protein GCM10020367_36210 [Streptomyces sannanensis]|uniref:LPXTG cell wall anchor domain-containing protein n=1 Tax=Streptomyces sannanensis TaxID=285536 RepID=A0ABP6SDI4_9ACTN
MKIRHVVATAVAAAVATPAVLLAATPAVAEPKPVPVVQAERKPSIAELEKAVAEAKKAYEAAVAAESAARKAADEARSDTAPLAVAAAAARKEAEAAATAKDTADKALADAKAALAALDVNATPEQKTAAEQAVADAEKDVTTTTDAKAAADTKLREADKAVADAKDAADRKLNEATRTKNEALAALQAAEQALADAKEGDTGGGDIFIEEPRLTSEIVDLPSGIIAGTSVEFTLRLTNGTEKTMDDVRGTLRLSATDKSSRNDLHTLLKLQYSTPKHPKWGDTETDVAIGGLGPVKPGGHADIKFRLTVDAKAPAADGVASVTGDFQNNDGSFGGNGRYKDFTFGITPASGKPDTSGTSGTSGTEPQGSKSPQPVNATLAATGSSSVMPQIALAGGFAMVLGAGAVYVARRRGSGA